jgi:hypothetical protein
MAALNVLGAKSLFAPGAIQGTRLALLHHSPEPTQLSLRLNNYG